MSKFKKGDRVRLSNAQHGLPPVGTEGVVVGSIHYLYDVAFDGWEEFRGPWTMEENLELISHPAESAGIIETEQIPAIKSDTHEVAETDVPLMELTIHTSSNVNSVEVEILPDTEETSPSRWRIVWHPASGTPYTPPET